MPEFEPNSPGPKWLTSVTERVTVCAMERTSAAVVRIPSVIATRDYSSLRVTARDGGDFLVDAVCPVVRGATHPTVGYTCNGVRLSVAGVPVETDTQDPDQLTVPFPGAADRTFVVLMRRY